MSSSPSSSATIRHIDENARRLLEADWRQGCPRPIEDYLPAADAPVYGATLEELVLIELELAWKKWGNRTDEDTAGGGNAGRPASIEDYLKRFPGLHQAEIVRRLLEQEHRARHRWGHSPSPAECDYRRRFPDLDLTPRAGPTPVRGSSTAPALPVVPGFEVLEVLARGGMGVVYKARQVRLNRIVALKMILTGGHASAMELARFRIEAEAVARLQHPNFVTIHEYGDHDGQPYFAMELLEGGNLGQKLGAVPQPAGAAAKLVETLARAMHYAHLRGVVHRDLKPSNVLLAADGTPKIADFGLAKQLDGDSDRTGTGTVVGTPSYMAPEQAAGRSAHVGPTADVWALGAILYEVLTGRPPFRADTAFNTLAQVLAEEPISPRRLQSHIPLDLEIICLKCLEKEPVRRYASAEVLADDLGRFRAGIPILARPLGTLSRFGRWCRRKPLPAALVGLVVAVAIAATGVAFWMASVAEQADRDRRYAVEQEKDAREKKAIAEDARRKAIEAQADLYTAMGLVADDSGKPDQAFLWFAHAARLSRDDPDRTRANRLRARSWGRLLPHPIAAIPPMGDPIRLEIHPHGSHVLALAENGRCLVWDLKRDEAMPWPGEHESVAAAAWAPGGDMLALAMTAGPVMLVRFPSGEVVRRLPSGRVKGLAFSADGRLLAVAGKVVDVWDLNSGQRIKAELPHSAPVVALAFDATGDRLATASEDGFARTFSLRGRDESSPTLFPHRALNPKYLIRPQAPVFVAGGKGLLTVSGTAEATWWDAASGAEVRRIPFRQQGAKPLLFCIAADPKGKYLALGGFSGAQLIDAATGQPVGEYLVHQNHVTGVVFSPQGDRLLTVSEDRTARLWSVPSGALLEGPIQHQGGLVLAAFSQDGRSVATAQGDGLVRVWALAEGTGDHRMPIDGGPTFARLSPNGRLALAAGCGGYAGTLRKLHIFDATTGQTFGDKVIRPGGLLMDAALAPDGRLAVTLVSLAAPAERNAPQVPEGRAGQLRFWDYRKGEPHGPAVAMPSEPRSVVFSPDGTLVVCVCVGGQVLVVETAAARVVQRLEHGTVRSAENTWPTARFTPDGRTCITWGVDHQVCVWDTATWKLRCPPLEHRSLVYEVDLSPDGRRLATGSWDTTARVWDLQTGAPEGSPLQHPESEWVFGCRFSPDGQTLLTSCRDHRVRLWDWRAGRVLHPPCKHEDAVFCAVFTPDGRHAVTGSRDGVSSIWDLQSGKLVAPPYRLQGAVWNVILTPDGRRAVFGGLDTVLVSRNLGDLTARDDGNLDELCTLGEVLSGQRLLEGDVEGLTSQEWLKRWRDLRSRQSGR